MRGRETLVPLRGRDAVLERLVGHLRTAGDGRLRVALVEGEPGIGKTRLLAGLGAELLALGFSVRSGRGEELGMLNPLGLVLDALGLVPVAGVDGEAPDSWCYRMLQVVLDALEASTGDGPVLVILDDLQWADSASLLLLRTLAGRAAGRPLAVLAAFRPVPRDSDFNETLASLVEAGALRVRLEPLDDASVRDLAEAILGVRAGEALLNWVRGAGGNPLYIQELLYSAEEAGRLERRCGEAILSAELLPRALSVLLDRRVAALSPETADKLKVAAVLGDGFTAHGLAAVLGQATGSVLPALDEALEAGLLASRESRLRFSHDLMRETLYRRIPGGLLASLHREAARILSTTGAPAGVRAEHLLRAGDDPGVVPMLLDASRDLAGTGPRAAADLVARALELMGPGAPEREQAAVDLVRLLAWAGRPERAAARAEAFLAGGLSRRAEARLRVGLAEAMIFRGLARGVLDQLALARSLEPLADEERAPLFAAAAHAHLFTGSLDEVENDVHRAIAAADRVGDDASACFALLARTIRLRGQGRLDESLQAAQEAVLRADNGSLLARGRHPRLFLAPTLFSLGRIEEAEAAYRHGRAAAEELGSTWSLPVWAAFRSVMLRSLGRWDEATAEAEAAVQIGDELEQPNVTPMARAVLADIAAHRSDMATARRHVEHGDALLRKGVSWTGQFLAWGGAAVDHASGDHAAASARLIDAGLDAGALDVVAQDHGLAADLVHMLLAAGERARAERIAALAGRVAQLNPAVTALRASALHCRGLATGDGGLLHRAAVEFATTPFAPARAAACEDAGVAAARDGARPEAVALLEQARSLQAALGADLDLDRIDATLRTLGVRRRRTTARVPASSGWASLTAAEARIAGLVAEGLSNPKIAARLFVSRHTVESHLKHIYAKLRIDSRVQLATLASDRSRAPQDP